jgi:hypothetical protein
MIKALSAEALQESSNENKFVKSRYLQEANLDLQVVSENVVSYVVGNILLIVKPLVHHDNSMTPSSSCNDPDSE